MTCYAPKTKALLRRPVEPGQCTAIGKSINSTVHCLLFTVHFEGASERMKFSKSHISFSLSVDLKGGIILTPLMMR